MQGMQEGATRRLNGFASALALTLCLAPAATAAEVAPAPAAPVPSAAPAPAAVTQTAGSLAAAPQVRLLQVKPVRGRVLRVRLELSRDAVVAVCFRRMPTGTLVTRRFTMRAGRRTLTVARGLRTGRYGVRVIANDTAGGRTSVRAAPVDVRR